MFSLLSSIKQSYRWVFMNLSIFMGLYALTGWKGSNVQVSEALFWMVPFSLFFFYICNVQKVTFKTVSTVLVSSILFSFLSENISGPVAITPDAMKHWSKSYLALIICAVILTFFLIIYHLSLAYASGRRFFLEYCFNFFGSILFLTILILAFQVKFHFHHYLWSGYLACFTCFHDNKISLFTRNALIGVFIQGMSAYGPDPIFYQ